MAKLLRRVLGSQEDPTDVTATDPEDQKMEKLLHNWNPPSYPLSDIYHLKGFSQLDLFYNKMFAAKNAANKVETLERTVYVKDEYEEFPMLGRDAIGMYKQWRYRFIHVGLIQVAVKPLTPKALDSHVVVCVCDGRFVSFRPSVLALFESSLCDGPIYFSCYPCFMVPIDERRFNLKIKTSGFHGNSGDIAVVYRVYYRLLSSTLFDPKVKANSSKEGITTLVETNLVKDNVPVSRSIPMDMVEVPVAWEA